MRLPRQHFCKRLALRFSTSSPVHVHHVSRGHFLYDHYTAHLLHAFELHRGMHFDPGSCRCVPKMTTRQVWQVSNLPVTTPLFGVASGIELGKWRQANH